MLILLVNIVKILIQNTYNDAVKKCDSLIRNATCPCCRVNHGMIRYGTYPRKFRSSVSPDQTVTINIQRFRCKKCGATHAVFLSLMIPFFRITLPDACSLLSAPDFTSREKIAIDLSMDDDSIRYVSNRYHFEWEDKIMLPGSHSCIELAAECFSRYKMWFLKKRDMKRKLTVSIVPTYHSCNTVPYPLII